jgi:hypothetical protein
MWVVCMFSFLRILIIFTFFLDYDDIQTVIEKVHLVIAYIMIGVMILSFFIELIKILVILIVFIKKNHPLREIKKVEKPTLKFINKSLIEENIKKRKNKNIHIYTVLANTKFPQ